MAEISQQVQEAQQVQQMQRAPQVLLVEDQPDAQAMLGDIVRQAFGDVTLAECITVAHAMAQVGKPWALALIDLRLLDGSGLDVLRTFKAAHPQVPAIVTTMYSDDDSIFQALQAGADGYLLKTEPPELLLDSLRSMQKGEVPLSPMIARRMLRFFRQPLLPTLKIPSLPPGSRAQEVLTAREIEVLAAIGEGMSIQETAERLRISYHTVNGHIKAIYRKLDINCRAQAAVEAQRRGLM